MNNSVQYKQGKIISMPDDWHKCRLEDVVLEHKSGIFKNSKYYGEGSNIIGVSNLYDTNSIKGQIFRLVQLSKNELNEYALKKGDLIYGESSIVREGIARTLYVTKDGEGTAFAWHTRRFKINQNEIISQFLNYLLNSTTLRREFMRVSTQTALTGITTIDFFRVMIAFPGKIEQKKIAQILSKWDDRIEKIEKLIDAKKKLKKALCQQLLTGKKRFKEFKGQKWKEERLGKLFKQRKESGYDHLPLLAITGSDGVRERDGLERRDTSSNDKSRYLRICPGDIGYNTMRMWQGVNGVSDHEGIVSPAYTICIPDKKKVDSNFMGYLFKFHPVVFLFYRHSQGLVSDTWNLKFRYFSEIKVTTPPLKEQQKIASVLNAADKEIELLNDKLEALRQQKKGLMQKLLTGKDKG